MDSARVPQNAILKALTEAQLALRSNDIICNIHMINEKGLISFDVENPVFHHWMWRLTEVQAEIFRRHGDYPDWWTEEMTNSASLLGSIKAARQKVAAFKLVPSRPLEKNCLVKYAPRKFLEPALKKGDLRISPAATYSDASLNVAIRDDELSQELFPDPRVPLFNTLDPGMNPGQNSRVKVQRRISSNYYVYCVSDTLSSRLMLDFEADSCLVIWDSDELRDAYAKL